MRAVVTGAGGFAGQWLVRSLVSADIPVVAWAHKTLPDVPTGVQARLVDITDNEAIRAAMSADEPTMLYHLAAVTHLGDCQANPTHAFRVNTWSTLKLLEAMPEGCRAVFASTCHVYGPPSTLPISEKHPTTPDSVYAESKLKAEEGALDLNRDVVIARAFHHTGPGQSSRYVLADWADQIRNGASSISVGDLSLKRDFTDVRDIVGGYIHLMKHGTKGEVYNLCSGVAPELGTFLSWLIGNQSIQARPDPKRFRDKDIPEFRGCPAKVESLGWARQFEMRETLERMSRT